MLVLLGTFELTKVTNDEVTINAKYITSGKPNKLVYDRSQFEQMLQNKTWEKV